MLCKQRVLLCGDVCDDSEHNGDIFELETVAIL